MATGLDVSDVVNVTVTLAPIASGYRNFGALLVLGSSSVIDVSERIRQYAGIDGIASDFGTDAPEYKAALLFFSQSPKPNLLYVGRWAQNATAGLLHGAVLTPSQQLLSVFTAITTGTLTISVDGTSRVLTGLNLSTATNLNGVASLVQTALAALSAGAKVVWDAEIGRFTVTSGTTGATSTVSYGTGSVATAMGLVSGSASVPVNGIASEDLAACVATLADVSSQWYGLTIATSTPPTDADYLNVAAFIEASQQSRVFGVTVTNTNVLDPTTSADLASALKTLGYKRTFSQYSSSSPYAVTSIFGRAFTVNFEAANSTLTIKFKQEPGVAAETLTETQAATLKAKNTNAFVAYNNGTAIIQEGVMANGYFFDEVHGLDWFQNALQNDLWNLLYQSATKIPQTDAGIHQLLVRAESTCDRAVNNGLLAPGQWNGDPIGNVNTTDMLPKGYECFVQPIGSQPPADREARKAPPILIAAKFAGAVHFADVAVTVNR